MAADAEAVSAIPPGVLVTWAQRNDQVMVGVELPGCTSAECDFADSGGAAPRAAGVDGAETRLTLALRSAIVAADRLARRRRGVQLVLPKLKLGKRTAARGRSSRTCASTGSVDGRRGGGGGARRAHAALPPSRAQFAPPRRPKLSARARRAADSRQPDRPRRLPDERSDGCAARPPGHRCTERSAPPPQPRAGKIGATTCSPFGRATAGARARHVARRRRGREIPCASPCFS